VSVTRCLIFLLLCGCATEQLKVERGLTAAKFTSMRGTPEVAARLKEYPPYAFIQLTEKNKKPRYVFSSPARRTIFVGDEAAMKRYSAYLTAQQQSEQMRRLQGQQRAANFQQALAYGLAAGAMQQPVYQPVYQPPPTVNVASAFGHQAPANVQPQSGTYLGKLSANPYDPDSISNPYGRYGSPYSSTSINNPYSTYGSPYSPKSPNNPYATDAPVLIGR
jgi:hypothetical protein